MNIQTRFLRRTSPVVCALVLALVAPSTAADLLPSDSENLTAPLDPTDPRAQLDPGLEDVPDMPVDDEAQPRRRPLRGRSSDQAIVHDHQTGRTWFEPVRRNRRPNGPSLESVQSVPDLETEGFTGSVPVEPESVEEPNGLETVSKINGKDGRSRVRHTRHYPNRTRVKLFIGFPNSRTKRYGCSGTLVGPRHVLTNGHCIYNRGRGGYANYVQVVPGLDGTYRPYGSAYGRRSRTVRSWYRDQSPEHDYALVTLDRSIGQSTGWVGMASYSSSTLKKAYAYVAGYPGDKGSVYMYADSGYFRNVDSKVLKYDMDTNKGMSGSGLLIRRGNFFRAVGVHRGTCRNKYRFWSTRNCGPRITNSRLDQLSDWMGADARRR